MKRLILALPIALVAFVALAPAANAQTFSVGCTRMNDPLLDAGPLSAVTVPFPFAAGETVTVAAAEPTDFGPPTAMSLLIDGVPVATGPFPGTLQAVLTAPATSVGWTVNAGNATWEVSCEAADPAALLDILVERVDGLNLSAGIEKSLLAKLTGARASLQAGDTAGACGKLTSFIAAVKALSAKAIAAEDAAALIDSAGAGRGSIGCG